MILNKRIEAFVALGNLLKNLSESTKSELFRKALSHNSWFTEDNLKLSFDGIINNYLDESKLKKWLAPYNLPEEIASPKKVGIVMAGNIPMVGFHDFLSVLISGHILYAKLSSQDPVLVPFIANELCEIEPAFKKQLFFADRLNNMDAVIATGSDNSARYFEYYFQKVPHIIRKNRTSCAILTGKESDDELKQLGQDITQYFGLGCRNVSKLFVPEGYNFNQLFENLQMYEGLGDYHKYANNYDYNKSIYLINRVPHLDTGFMLYKEDQAFVSPISVVFYEYYQNLEDLAEKLKEKQDKIQCTVGLAETPANVSFGNTQNPELWDYADGVDTIAFLKSLS